MKAGFGFYSITPRVGVELCGFGPYHNRKSVGIHDLLEARVGAFEAGGRKTVIVTCDLCGLGDSGVAEIRSVICKKHPELQPGDIMVCCSHTHSGPATSDRECDQCWGRFDPTWYSILPYRVAEAAYQALENMTAVKVSQALVPCRHIGLNRVYDKDNPPLEDVLKEDWEPAKPEYTDTECRVIRFDTVDGNKLIGFMTYFGCHPVCCCDDNHYITGDYPGVAMHNLMREFPGSVGMFLQGAMGDVNSGCVYKKEQESLLALDVFAARFANAVRKGLNQAKEVPVGFIQNLSRKFKFTTKQVFTREWIEKIRSEQSAILLRADADEAAWKTRTAACYLRCLDKVEDLLRKTDGHDIEAEMHLIRMGGLEFIGAPFEIMQAIKNEVHAKSSAEYPMLISLADGSHGYAPDNQSLTTTKLRGDYAAYATITVALMGCRLPYADIHNELVKYSLELEKEAGGRK